MTVPDAVELLLVEDNEEDLTLALRALRKANLANKIHIVRDGAEALDFIFCEGVYAARRIEEVPHVILLDLKLPKISGIEILKRVRADPRTKAIAVVVLTSSKQENAIIDGYGLGASSYIVKPIDFEGFSAAVRDLGLSWLVLNHPPPAKP